MRCEFTEDASVARLQRRHLLRGELPAHSLARRSPAARCSCPHGGGCARWRGQGLILQCGSPGDDVLVDAVHQGASRSKRRAGSLLASNASILDVRRRLARAESPARRPSRQPLPPRLLRGGSVRAIRRRTPREDLTERTGTRSTVTWELSGMELRHGLGAALLAAYGIVLDLERTRYYRLLYDLAPRQAPSERHSPRTR